MTNIKQHWLLYHLPINYPRYIQVLKSNIIISNPRKTIRVTTGTLLNTKNNPLKISWEMFYLDKHKTFLLELYDMDL